MICKSVPDIFQNISFGVASGSAPAVKPANRGRGESRDVDAKCWI